MVMSDGTARVVALQKSYWDCLDWMVSDRGESLGKITDFCLKHLQECPNDQFNAVLEFYIHRYMQEELATERGVANTDYFSSGKDRSE